MGITVDGKRIHLGLFKTPEEAYEAYTQAKKELHISSCRVYKQHQSQHQSHLIQENQNGLT